jgi:hypothetical protein
VPEIALATPIRRGRGDDLRKYLRGLPDTPEHPGPFARRDGATHTMRFVVMQTDVPRLLFSSRFDGDESDYLTWLSGVTAAQDVWAHCERPYDPGADALRRYLLDEESPDRLPDTYSISLVKDGITVPGVNAALGLREQLRQFALEAQAMTATEMAHAFRALGPVRRVAEP